MELRNEAEIIELLNFCVVGRPEENYIVRTCQFLKQLSFTDSVRHKLQEKDAVKVTIGLVVLDDTASHKVRATNLN